MARGQPFAGTSGNDRSVSLGVAGLFVAQPRHHGNQRINGHTPTWRRAHHNAYEQISGLIHSQLHENSALVSHIQV